MRSGARRRLLVVARSLPEPADEGYRVRVGGLLAGLVRHHDVTLIAAAEPGPASAAVTARLAAAGIAAIVVPDGLSRRCPAAAAGRADVGPAARRRCEPGGSPRRSGGGRVGQLRPRPARGQRVPRRPARRRDRPAGIPLVIDEHNVWSDLAAGRAACTGRDRAGSPAGSRPPACDGTRIGRGASAAVVLFTSERDRAAALARQPGIPAVVVPNGVDLEQFRPVAPGAVDAGRLAFFGLLSYTPNRDAVAWLARTVLPLVLARRPDAVLDVIGRGCAGDVAGRPGPRRSTRRCRRRYPVGDRTGCGRRRPASRRQRNAAEDPRVAGHGKAVISTTVGAEGLAVEAGRDLLIEDDCGGHGGRDCRAPGRSLAPGRTRRGRPGVRRARAWLAGDRGPAGRDPRWHRLGALDRTAHDGDSRPHRRGPDGRPTGRRCGRLLRALAGQTLALDRFEVLVVVNGAAAASDDPALSAALDEAPGLRLRSDPPPGARTGSGGQRRRGRRRAAGSSSSSTMTWSPPPGRWLRISLPISETRAN